MPFIDLKTTAPIPPEKEAQLRAAFGRDIACLRGKSEQWLMLNFSENCRMAFRGAPTPDLAMLEVKIFGSASASEYDRLTAALTDSVRQALGVSPDRIYIRYEEGELWGYNGSNF